MPHLASSFSDQRQHGQVSAGVAGHHPQQCALADSAAAEDAQALAPAAGEETIHRADSRTDRLPDGGAAQRLWRRRVQQLKVAAGVRSLRIHWLAAAVDNSSSQARSDAQLRFGSPGHHPVAVADSRRLLQGHGQHRGAAKADNLSGKDAAGAADDFAQLAHRAEWPFR